ncbi:hypothetical protein [Tsukamurella ocularis]|uniref:hypothetical protein n=1 Tax=Tsukamurella ocularis TaxID=1970234 RepID=UPI002166FAA9|nr:hypothetical protein [Tsukamurella ocularis]MCS3781626.1 hypothetical protein [Tsukamurella ocularis]MCS3788120.1 hypothetical protein [Tsukamurella ocularis]MCS3851840.1 hypothetical protein [Tsukamurella ocularis]
MSSLNDSGLRLPLRRRTFLTGSLAAMGALLTPGCTSAPRAGAELADRAALWSWVEKMTEGGPRFTGSPAHRRWIDYVQRELESFGLSVDRFPTPLRYWNATSWALTATDSQGRTHEIPVAYYWPYSGSTPIGGIAGTLADAADSSDLAGKVALVDRKPAAIADAVLRVAVDTRPGTLAADLKSEDATRLWTSESLTLRSLRERGAVAAIGILPAAPEAAKGQFSPHQQPHDGLPALQLDREQGARLRQMLARGPVTMNLTLIAETDDDASIDYLAAKLPGNGKKSGAVLLMTHTDGQNAIEENGAAAVLAITQYLARLPRDQRDRDVQVVFSPAHMTADSSAVHPEKWLEQTPAIKNQLIAAVVPEHLGALQWDAGGADRPWNASGKQELLILGVGNSDNLTQLVTTELDKSDLDRTVVAKPYTNNLYGEATGPYRLGIPTVTAIAGPNYLVQVDENQLDKLDSALAHRQTRYLLRVTERLLTDTP